MDVFQRIASFDGNDKRIAWFDLYADAENTSSDEKGKNMEKDRKGRLITSWFSFKTKDILLF